MARLNKKSTKNAIVKLLKENEVNTVSNIQVEQALLAVARELEIHIKTEDYIVLDGK